jgi:hypothetical protein
MKTIRLAVLGFIFYHINPICAQNFTDVAEKVGLYYDYPGITNYQIGGGVTVLDVNNDGWDDIFQAGGIFPSHLWINHHGKFKDESIAFGLTIIDSLIVQSAVSGDINNDGYTDLFICNFGRGIGAGDHHLPILLLNDRGKRFTKFDKISGIEVGNYSSATMGDYNKDGFLDLYVTNYIDYMTTMEDEDHRSVGYNPTCLPDMFFVNHQGNYLVESADFFKLNNVGCGLATSFTDYDNDGDVDLMLMNDFGAWTHQGNQLYRNEYPKNEFNNVSTETGFYKEIYGMGIGPGDYDNDGDLDYFITNIGGNFLLKNSSEKFIDQATELNLENMVVEDSLPGTGWSGIFFDMDNDGDLDLYVAQGNVEAFLPKAAIKDPNKLYQNTGSGTFTDISAESGLNDIISHRGAALIDYDHDGDMDIVSSPVKLYYGAYSGASQRMRLYQNNLNSANKWMKIKLVGDNGTNYSAIGSRVEIEANGVIQIREIDGGSGHASQSSLCVHFGLGKTELVDKVTIKWLNGKVQIFEKLKPNSTYKIFESGKIKKE